MTPRSTMTIYGYVGGIFSVPPAPLYSSDPDGIRRVTSLIVIIIHLCSLGTRECQLGQDYSSHAAGLAPEG